MFTAVALCDVLCQILLLILIYAVIQHLINMMPFVDSLEGADARNVSAP